MRASNEYAQNPTNRRGVVVDRDPKTMRVKVQFQDEDDVVTQWIDVTAKSATGTSAFQMPGHNDEVWCAMDAKGEAGCLLGSRYNSKDAPPASSNDVTSITFPGGSIVIDTASGNMTVKSSGAVTIEAAGDVTIKAANIVLESGKLTHNGKNIGHDHGHVSAPPGPSGPPV
ncbi:phage baseplate assembly protein gpV [Agrobacterium vitis]|nr:phage baseplate assembly protein gpV [Agrobacterium vitis]MBE1440395.1 phage baseplate assembly protein gpV [Agrobacterium vitis]